MPFGCRGLRPNTPLTRAASPLPKFMPFSLRSRLLSQDGFLTDSGMRARGAAWAHRARNLLELVEHPSKLRQDFTS
jgi:hypothetical protein